MSTASSKRESSNSEKNTYNFSLPYIIFNYKEELRKRDTHFIKLSKAKIYLTDILIYNMIRNIRKYDVEELININQQMSLKTRLYKKIRKIRNLEELGIKDIDPNSLSDDL